jgi:oxygen-independent coproporphyrinogen III oxidase
MAGIYIHIPFCKKACHYCNFHFSTSLHRKADFLKALHAEIHAAAHYHPYLNAQPAETLYLGGGTPSLLTFSELESLFELLHEKFSFVKNSEITMEANPDDINPDALKSWKQLGINRLSIGTQSFFEDDLKWMNRAHNAVQAEEAIRLAHGMGFDNLNIDLIYGTPTLSDENWMRNLEKARTMGINHLSCYALTVEENTALQHFVKKGKTLPPEEGHQARQFEILQDWAERREWEHYEISNLCTPGHRSRHNSHYWTGKPYAGFGPSAHSFDGFFTRKMGIANNALYIKAWLENIGKPYDIESLTEHQRLNEKIMTGIRLIEGIELTEKERIISNTKLSEKQWNQMIKTKLKCEENGFIELLNNKIILTKKGRLFADAIASWFFL